MNKSFCHSTLRWVSLHCQAQTQAPASRVVDSIASSCFLLSKLFHLPLSPLQYLHQPLVVACTFLGPDVNYVLKEPVPIEEHCGQSHEHGPKQNGFGKTLSKRQLGWLHDWNYKAVCGSMLGFQLSSSAFHEQTIQHRTCLILM